MKNEKQPTLTGYRKRKSDRVEHYNKYVKYWVQEVCSACGGSGYYDSFDSPDCAGCDGKGIDMWKPNYDTMLTNTDDMIGKKLVCKVDDTIDLKVYVNKRREIIYEYDHLVDPSKNKRIRARLYVDYKYGERNYDWVFKDMEDNEVYLSDLSIEK